MTSDDCHALRLIYVVCNLLDFCHHTSCNVSSLCVLLLCLTNLSSEVFQGLRCHKVLYLEKSSFLR